MCGVGFEPFQLSRPYVAQNWTGRRVCTFYHMPLVSPTLKPLKECDGGR